MSARIVIISGPIASGKTSISRILAVNSAFSRAVHIHTDDFYEYIRKGYELPWLTEAGDQNETVINAVTSAAHEFYKGGYDVFVDGLIGPWFIKSWVKLANSGADVRYIILRPNEVTTIKRATEREQKPFPIDAAIVSGIWRSFSELAEYESHAIDTSSHTISESVALIEKTLAEGAYKL